METYKTKIEHELYANCEEIVTLIRTEVLQKEANAESKAFFLKMIGDYNRYISESAKDQRLENCKNDALKAY